MKKLLRTGLISVAVALGAGCASDIAPRELVSARMAYNQALDGPAARLDPTALHVAKQTLDAAESSFADHGSTQGTRDLAYAAERRVQIAEANAQTMQVRTDTREVTARMHAATEAQARASAEQLQRTREQLDSTQQALQQQGAALQTEVQRRQEAEKRAAQAAEDLAKFATVKQETRGMVITLSGSVLFVSGKAELLPAAQLKLNEVAKALTEQDPDSQITVEGHTDSQGKAASNQELSEKRARAVRDYLISRGIAADRITAEGLGSSRPLADNSSAEGRANNRRVEIVVKPRE